MIRVSVNLNMSHIIPDNDEQDRIQTLSRIKAYLIHFHENETKGAVVKNGKLMLKKKKPGMMGLIKKDMNPAVKGVCGCKKYTKLDGKKSWMIKFEMWDKNVPEVEMDLNEAKHYGTHVLAYYSNMQRFPLKHPEWEWTADESIWPVQE